MALKRLHVELHLHDVSLVDPIFHQVGNYQHFKNIRLKIITETDNSRVTSIVKVSLRTNQLPSNE